MTPKNHQPLRIHQFHYSVSATDGVSHHMLFIQSALKEIGISGEIFASKTNGISFPQILLLNPEKMWDCDLLIIHHSQGNPDLAKLTHIEIPKMLIYHTITPSHFYPHDPSLADLSRLGTLQLASLKTEVMASFAASQFNRNELIKQHYNNPQIIPLLDLPIKLKEVPLKRFQFKNTEPKNILFVGRITRHKNQALLVQTFFHLKTQLPKNSKLTLVGGHEPIYLDYIKLLCQQLGLSNEVRLTGNVTKKVLEQYYESADAFVCVSEHEGFCIPLLEAMCRNIPTFFFPETGVKETMGKGGVSIETKRPEEIAQILATILKNPKALQTILKSQVLRMQELKKEQNARILQKQILELVTKVRTSPEIHFDKAL